MYIPFSFMGSKDAALELKGLDFDGVNQYVSLNNMRNLNWTSFSTEFWVNRKNNSQFKALMGSFDSGDGTSPAMQFCINLQNVGDIYFLIRHSGNSRASFRTSNSVLLPNTWHHVVIQRTGTNSWEFWVDGVEVSSNSVSTINTEFIDINDFEFPIIVGGRNVRGTIEITDCFIADVRFWDKVLTPAEINENRTKFLCGNEVGLRAYYPMNQITGTSIPELTGKYNDATIFNNPTVTDTNIILTPC